MSPQNLSGSPTKKPYDVYTVMLYCAFIALLTGCILLYLEMSSYGSFPWWGPSTGS